MGRDVICSSSLFSLLLLSGYEFTSPSNSFWGSLVNWLLQIQSRELLGDYSAPSTLCSMYFKVRLGVIRSMLPSYSFFICEYASLRWPFWHYYGILEFRPYNSSAVHGHKQINPDDDDVMYYIIDHFLCVLFDAYILCFRMYDYFQCVLFV